MKASHHSFFAIFCLTIVSLLMVHPAAQAGYVVTLSEAGSDVIAVGSGAIDLTGLGPVGNINASAELQSQFALIITGPASNTSMDEYKPIGGPFSLGTNSTVFNASSGSGDAVGVLGFNNILFVPAGYISDAPLADTATYLNQSFSSLGLTPGIYEWTWGDGLDQNFTVNVVPEPAASTILTPALATVFLLARLRRRKVSR